MAGYSAYNAHSGGDSIKTTDEIQAAVNKNRGFLMIMRRQRNGYCSQPGMLTIHAMKGAATMWRLPFSLPDKAVKRMLRRDEGCIYRRNMLS